MNFKIFLLFFALGCGVKGDPAAPKSSSIPSLLNNYPDIETSKPMDDQRKIRR